MGEIKIKIPDDLRLGLDGLSETKLTLMANKLVKEELERLARLKRITSKSELTEKRAAELSTKVSESLAKRYEKML
ncbi:hypothetical protein AKJ50_00350 [candidate division MSBL1 archaeon SCGC-AAA382A13]|uniref:Uncharacterized protein n=1 Tax=candidate division MSBL1 archaeon SCGC-AAA382A13 TaxID=1698279 RepID=A0A133VGU0_9EURY|nr:hypothetical protein AKJ50_00350 [candidate division MSBL1 archaeon SCGC-AAA382A13]